MTFACSSPDGDHDGLNVDVVCRTNGRPTIHVYSTSGAQFVLDENHAEALVLALQAAITEVRARAVSL